MTKLLKEPLVQFLLIGACIYAVYTLSAGSLDSGARDTIYVSAERIASLQAAWEKRWNRQPTEAELAGLVRAWLREDLLYREALEMGLDTGDEIIRRRLAQKLQFLTDDLAELKEPETAELEAYFSSNMRKFREPDRISFVQVFLNPEKRGVATPANAEKLLADLRSRGVPDRSVAELGDELMFNDYYEQVAEPQIRRALGAEFAAAIMQLEPGDWHGPIASGFGSHLVYVYELLPAPDPQLANVIDDVHAEWQREQTRRFNADYYASLQGRYDIDIEASSAFVAAVMQPDYPGAEVAPPDDEAGL